MKNQVYKLLTELSSRKFISKLVGAFAKSKYSRKWIVGFSKQYNIITEDAEKSIAEYESLNDFFTRRLKPGLRTIPTDLNAVICPVDALITVIGSIVSGQLLNVKGQDYSLQELLNDSPRTINYVNGHYIVLYLSPSDYHRIHVPIHGTIVEKDHLVGKVYPVNDFGLRHMPKVLSRNERLITYIRHEYGEVAVVKVGALNVSSIQYVDPLPALVKAGDDLAYFEFGSTVVLLIEQGIYVPNSELSLEHKVKFGQPLGMLLDKNQIKQQ